MKRATMKPDTGWAIISRDGLIPMDREGGVLQVYDRKRDAVSAVRDGDWNAERIARVEIREIAPRKRKAP